jgi:hypothetical protein
MTIGFARIRRLLAVFTTLVGLLMELIAALRPRHEGSDSADRSCD